MNQEWTDQEVLVAIGRELKTQTDRLDTIRGYLLFIICVIVFQLVVGFVWALSVAS